LTQQQSLDLYKAFVRDTLDIARKAHADQRIVAFDSDGSVPTFLKRIAPDFLIMKQKGRTLGCRLHNASLSQVGTGNKHVVIIGSDAPNLPAKIIEEAFVRLKRSDVVFGPALDGGYYLVGMKNPCKRLFQGIAWSSSEVLLQSIAKARKMRMRVGVLAAWYDVDDKESLKLLIDDVRKTGLKTGQYTRRVLQCMNLKPTIR